MKKVIFLVCFFLSMIAHAEVEKAMMEDYIPVTNRDFAFEVKTKEFDQVVLDCGGFLGWMTFMKNGKIAHNVYMDTYSDCPNMHDYLSKAKENDLPVCMQVDGDHLTVSNEAADCE